MCTMFLFNYVLLRNSDALIIGSVISIRLGDSNDDVTIVIVTVTIMTVIAKNCYRDSRHVVTSIYI